VKGAPRDARIVVVGVCMESDRSEPMLGILKELNVQYVLAYTPDEFAASLRLIRQLARLYGGRPGALGMIRLMRHVIGHLAIPGGLVVPVIQDADKKGLGQIARESKSLIEKARTNKLAPSEYEGGTFTISNLGMYGVDQFTPVINVPEACIMGVGAIVPTPVVQDGEITVRDRMRVTLSCDHRVANGAVGAEFLQALRRLLENPMLAVL